MRRLARWLVPFLLKFDADTIYFAPGTYLSSSTGLVLKDGQRVIGSVK